MTIKKNAIWVLKFRVIFRIYLNCQWSCLKCVRFDFNLSYLKNIKSRLNFCMNQNLKWKNFLKQSQLSSLHTEKSFPVYLRATFVATLNYISEASFFISDSFFLTFAIDSVSIYVQAIYKKFYTLTRIT